MRLFGDTEASFLDKRDCRVCASNGAIDLVEGLLDDDEAGRLGNSDVTGDLAYCLGGERTDRPDRPDGEIIRRLRRDGDLERLK